MVELIGGIFFYFVSSIILICFEQHHQHYLKQPEQRRSKTKKLLPRLFKRRIVSTSNTTTTTTIMSSTSTSSSSLSPSSLEEIRLQPSVDSHNNNGSSNESKLSVSSSTSSLQSLYNHLTKSCRLGGKYHKGFNPNLSTEDNYQYCDSESSSDARFVGPFAHIRQHKIDYTYHKNYSLHRQRLQNSIVWELLDPQRIFSSDDSNNAAQITQQQNSQSQRRRSSSTNADADQRTMMCTTPTEPWVLFVAGSQGVGKRQVIQFLIEKGNLPLLSFCFVDADEIAKCYLPEYDIYVQDYNDSNQTEAETDNDQTQYLNGHDKALEMCRKESGFLSELLLWVALEAGKNVVVSGQCKNIEWYKSLFKRIQQTYNNKKADEPTDMTTTSNTQPPQDSNNKAASTTASFERVHIGLLHITASPETVMTRIKQRCRDAEDESADTSSLGALVVCPRRTKLVMDDVERSVHQLKNYTNFFCCLQNNIPETDETTTNHDEVANDTHHHHVEIMTQNITWDNFRQTFQQTCLWRPDEKNRSGNQRRTSSFVKSAKALEEAIHTTEMFSEDSNRRESVDEERQKESIRETFQNTNGHLRGVIDEHFSSPHEDMDSSTDVDMDNKNDEHHPQNEQQYSTNTQSNNMGQMLRAIHDHSSTSSSQNKRKSFSIFKSTEENYRVDSSEEDKMEFYGLYAHLRAKLDYSYHSNYSRDRQYLQDTILEDMLRTVKLTDIHGNTCTTPTEPWAVFTAGAMGSGKSYTIRALREKHRFPLLAFVKVDPDEIRRLLPEYMLYSTLFPEKAGDMTNKECGYMVEILTLAALEAGKNVLVDGSLRDHTWYQNYFTQLRQDYPNLKIAILHITAPREAVLRRAAERAKTTGRVVPKSTLERALKEVPESVSKLKHHVDYFCELLNAPNADDIQIETQGETWETFTAQWHQICAWVPSKHKRSTKQKKKTSSNQKEGFIDNNSSSTSLMCSNSMVSTTNSTGSTTTNDNNEQSQEVLPPNFISWTQRPPLETFDDHLRSWSRQPSFTLLKRQTSSNVGIEKEGAATFLQVENDGEGSTSF